MKDTIDQYLNEIAAFTADSPEQVEALRIRFLGKKGLLNDLFAAFREVAPEHKKETGLLINQVKSAVQDKIQQLKEQIERQAPADHVALDVTLPVDFRELGTRHPLAIVRGKIIDIFGRLGFILSEGPEIEDDWHNFTALNFPAEHPARDMQDTFYLEKTGDVNNDISLRTHTSSVQVRVMETSQPPIRTISPGRVFRNEAISARAHCFFHQIEGLYIDEQVSFKDLKQTLLYFAKEMFGPDTDIRLRPSYFPFTEPSGEMDISCFLCGGKGCRICKGSGWVEILGCGMVDPAVLDNCGIDSEKYSGYAFGMGIERIAMLKYQINDLRLFSENDVRFLRQFEGAW